MGSVRKLSQSPMPSKQVLLLFAGIIHVIPVLDISLIPSHDLFSNAMRDTAIVVWFA